MGTLGQALAVEVAATCAAGNLPVVIAGDCTASIGVVAGLQQTTPDFTLSGMMLTAILIPMRRP